MVKEKSHLSFNLSQFKHLDRSLTGPKLQQSFHVWQLPNLISILWYNKRQVSLTTSSCHEGRRSKPFSFFHGTVEIAGR